MTTHRSLALLVLLALGAACGEPGNIPQTASPSSVVTAVFDPVSGNIPLPNDLALQPFVPGSGFPIPPNLPPAQQDLLKAFASQGGFPNDQEQPVTISFVRTNIAASGATTNVAPTLDVTTLNPTTLAVFLSTQQGSGTVALDPVSDADYVNAGDHGVLTLHNKNRAPWTPGVYVVALRGGPGGVKTKEGDPIYASQVFYLIAQGQDMTTPQNLALLEAQTGSATLAQQTAQQLNQIIAGYKAGAYPAVNRVFPQQELAAMTTFPIAGYGKIPGRPDSPLVTMIELDPGRGLVPLPIDLLRDPRPESSTCAACGKLTPLAACTLAQGTLDAQGVCRDSKGNVNAAAAGFATLDGFSTTGPILAPTSDLVVAQTITSDSVKLFDLGNPASPKLVDPTAYITEPTEFTQSGLSTAIVLQPAGASSGVPTAVFTTRPLKDDTDYAVVISDAVKDKTGASIGPGTVARILQLTNPVVDANGKSLLPGVDDPTAGALEVMRQKLAPALAASQFGAGHVAMAYTFHTQTIGLVAANLAALPYATGNKTLAPVPSSTRLYCSAAVSGSVPSCALSAGDIPTVFSAYGVDTSTVPDTHVAFVVETAVVTFNKLLCNPGDTTCQDTGAFSPPNVQPVAEPINVLVALPPPPYGSCVPSTTTQCTIPLVIFRHGLGRGRADMLRVADQFTAKGFGVAAIDAAKHGDRSYCKATSECAAGTCVPDPALANEGDAPLPGPGHCMSGSTPTDFKRDTTTCPGCTNTKSIPIASSNFLVSANFFRTRDTERQDIIDESQLARVLSPDPTGTQLGNLITTPILGVQFDPATISYVGQSLGAIQGTMDVAANPRFTRAVLNVGGGTTVDVFNTSPAFSAATRQLLASLGITPGANSAYLEFLVVSKMILDPAEPVNYAPALNNADRALPNILVDPTGRTPQSVKQGVLTQAAFCDQVVPNPFNFILDSTIEPFGFPPVATVTGNFQLFARSSDPLVLTTACPAPTSGLPAPASAIEHGFFTDWIDSGVTTTAQTDAASFLLDPAAKPPSLRPF